MDNISSKNHIVKSKVAGISFPYRVDERTAVVFGQLWPRINIIGLEGPSRCLLFWELYP